MEERIKCMRAKYAKLPMAGTNGGDGGDGDAADGVGNGTYKILKTLGKGGFSTVKHAIHMPTERAVAIKFIQKKRFDEITMKILSREIPLLKRLHHPNIVNIYQYFETESTLCLVVDYARNGNLLDYIVNNGRMREDWARVLYRQIISAMQYCHGCLIVHRDLKPANIYLDDKYNIKIGDFGVGAFYDSNFFLKSNCGTELYKAPEVGLGKKYAGPMADVWSCGVVLYLMVTATLPFRNTVEVQKGDYTVPEYISCDLENTLKKMLVKCPAQRTSLSALMNDKWLNIFNDTLQPYRETPIELNDQHRYELLREMGYRREEIVISVKEQRYDDIFCAYLLLDLAPVAPTIDNYKPALHSSESTKNLTRIQVNAQSSVSHNRFTLQTAGGSIDDDGDNGDIDDDDNDGVNTDIFQINDGGTLYEGHYATTKCALHLPTERRVVLKVIDKRKFDAGTLQIFFREIDVIKRINHPNIVKMYQHFETKSTFYQVMEYAGHLKLFDIIDIMITRSDRLVRSRFRDIVSALEYCHSKLIFHRNLTAENIFFDRGTVKIDFDVGALYDPRSQTNELFAAPEQLLGQRYSGAMADVWSCGVLLYFMITATLPFQSVDEVLKGEYTLTEAISSELAHTLAKMLVKCPAQRSTLKDIMNDEWINYCCDTLEPYRELPIDLNDQKRYYSLTKLGYQRHDIEASVKEQRYDDIFCAYMLLGLPEHKPSIKFKEDSSELKLSTEFEEISSELDDSTEAAELSYDGSSENSAKTRTRIQVNNPRKFSKRKQNVRVPIESNSSE